jgi:hypothetical protein
VAKVGSAPSKPSEPCTSRVSLFTPPKEFATYRVGRLAALVSLTGYSSQALGPGQQCINADYNPTLRLLDMVMLAAMTVSFVIQTRNLAFFLVSFHVRHLCQSPSRPRV